ncbi:SGNH/GDSL hydrolase family protein [Actinosynnema sp. NPDC047251]|uniref:Lipolytic protein, G-D-S-L family n=1 Tax=Saccharothrix espanaensis (strain ATCC 51144 / DSM 44229 / JCM 9112 / NBRC 15066 / NRRL 15764) TaxID=1179773 RepID=K0K0J4_SACES|nr:SGNH/GDSL hydrolase family protein [Saccharothrix espanaensis]CCH31871.1 Lipolytic protein, G-D-S-L family [Saccharothrix espanaensis DSM 44229]
MRARALIPALLALFATAALATPAQAAPLAGKYVAIGDSYTTAPGTRTYDNPNDACRRGPLTYPRLWAAAHPTTRFVEAACSGATTTEVVSNQIPLLTADTTLVTIQVGGNDVRFVDVLTNCILTIDDKDCLKGVELAKQAAVAYLSPGLAQVYGLVRAKAPAARVIVVGYPRLYKIGGNCGIFGLSDTERAALNSAADTLAAIMAQRAAEAGFTFLDARPIFDSHALCTSGTKWVTSLEWDKINESYHPNAAGHRDGYYAALNSLATSAKA